MHILLVADGRSPITRSWISALQPLGWQISLISTFPCSPINGAALAAVLPVAFARYAGSQAGTTAPAAARKGLVSRIRPLAQKVRYALGPWTLLWYRRRFRQLVNQLHPDLVHALRIPFEGMLASSTPLGIPLIVSTWGNDLTLHAPARPRMSTLTRQTLLRADALMSDTKRDALLVQQWGFDPAKPILVVPGNGGLDLAAMQKTVAGIKRADPPQIIDPRGLRSYVRTDIFFQAIPLVLAKYPDVRFVCTSMQGQKEALDWVKKLGIAANVTLLPLLTQAQLWQEFARSTLSVSLSTHDGTPNTLLEAMALGCLPICGDIDSIHEWIEPGENGLLVAADDPKAVANALLRGLEDTQLQNNAAKINQKLVNEKTSLELSREQIADFYRRINKNPAS
jgi:glycosyltransferase involved in cell wall biosynthesis